MTLQMLVLPARRAPIMRIFLLDGLERLLGGRTDGNPSADCPSAFNGFMVCFHGRKRPSMTGGVQREPFCDDVVLPIFFCGARCFFAHTHTRTFTQISTQSPHCGQTHVIFVLSTHTWGLCNVPSNSHTYLLSYMLRHCACKSLSNTRQDDCVCLLPFTRYQPCCLGHV